MPTFIEQQVQGLMNDLASCLCSTLANAAEAGEVPAVCFCGVIPGSDAVLDFCGDGQAWVRLAGIVPVIDEQFNDCVMQYDVTLEVGWRAARRWSASWATRRPWPSSSMPT